MGGVKLYRCEQCHRSYARKYDLNRHRKIHIGTQYHKCDYCHKKFFRRYLLHDHCKKKHAHERSYKCKNCGGSCKCRRGHSHHICVHNGKNRTAFECESCNKVFSEQNNCLCHRKSHDEENCRLNPETASLMQCTPKNQKSGLKKPYGCNLCSETFYLGSSLAAHKRKVHEAKNVDLQEDITKNSFKLFAEKKKHENLANKVLLSESKKLQDTKPIMEDSCTGHYVAEIVHFYWSWDVPKECTFTAGTN